MTTVNKNSEKNYLKNTFFIPFCVPKTDSKTHYPNIVNYKTKPLPIIIVAKLADSRKNLIFLLRSLLPLIKDNKITLTIFGMLKSNEDNSVNFRNLLEFIEYNHIENSVELNPNREYEVVLSSYPEHDLYILPSLNEPAAISHFEAMACGLPVIVTKQNGTNYIVDEGFNGFIFDPTKEKELRDKVQFFINHPQKIEEYGRNALKTIENSYRPTHFVKNIEYIITRITQ